MIIPRYLVIVRFLDVPSLDDAEIRKMIRFQAAKDIPYPENNMVISYRNLGSYMDGFSSIMLVVAKRDTIKGIVDGPEQSPEAIRLHSELLYLHLIEKAILSNDKVDLIVHIGKEASEIMIVDKKRPIFSRGFKNSKRFLDEIDHSILSYQRNKGNPMIDNVVVSYPPNVDIKDARPHIQKHFTIPVNFYEYSEGLGKTNLPSQINLVPEDVIQKKARGLRRKELLVTGLLAGFIALLIVSFFLFKAHQKNQILSILSGKAIEIQSDGQRLEYLSKKIDSVKDHEKKGRIIGGILENFNNLKNPDILLSGLSYDGKNTVVYKGHSENMQTVFSFTRRLERSKFFREAEVKHVTKKKIKNKEFSDFSIHCKISD